MLTVDGKSGDGDEKSDDDLQIADCTDSGKLQKMLINNRTVTG